MGSVVQAVGLGMIVMLVGTIPRNIVDLLLHGRAEWQAFVQRSGVGLGVHHTCEGRSRGTGQVIRKRLVSAARGWAATFWYDGHLAWRVPECHLPVYLGATMPAPDRAIWQQQHVVDVRDAAFGARLDVACDVGAGYGRMSAVLAEFAARVIGIEREPHFVRQAAGTYMLFRKP